MASQSLKDLRIVLGSCKRLKKDIDYYTKEAKREEEKAAKLRAEKADDYDVRKQEEIVTETLGMIPDSKSRYQTAVDDLRALVDNLQGEEGLEETSEWKEALAIVASE